MANIFIVNKALKFTWFNRIFKDTDNIQFWTAFLYQLFVIPLPDVLNCNIHPSNLTWLISPNMNLPAFWREIFTFWFNHFYIAPNCTDANKLDRLLNVPVTYNSSIFSPQLLHYNLADAHMFLVENGAILLKDFLREFHNFIPHVTQIDNTLAACLQEIFQCIPQSWCNHVVQCQFSTTQCLITDRLFAGLMPTKSFTELLQPHPVNHSAITKWEKDLQCTIESFLWQNICKRIKVIFFPPLRDFHVQFLNRAFHMNTVVSLYKKEVSPLCSFCFNVEETYTHIFWDCKYVYPIWIAIQDICYDTISEEDFSMFKCLLSNFQSPLLNFVTIVLKHHIHVCRSRNTLPTVSGVLKSLCKYRKIHLTRATLKNTLHFYTKFWDVWINDIVVNEIIQTWALIDNG